MKLFKVTYWFNCDNKISILEAFVIAGNEVEAKRITEEEVWHVKDIHITGVEEVNMSYPQLLCTIDTSEIN